MTYKPLIYAANVAEEDLADKGANNPHVKVGVDNVVAVLCGFSWFRTRGQTIDTTKLAATSSVDCLFATHQVMYRGTHCAALGAR